jgi:glyoxylate/hydroxypyruvate reductase
MRSGTFVLLYACFGVDPRRWSEWLSRLAPDIELRIHPAIGDPAEVDFVFTWDHPHGFLSQFTNLRAVFSLGAGVDRLLRDPELPRNIPVVRMVDTSLVAGMAEFVLMRALHYHRQMPYYEERQRSHEWAPQRVGLAKERIVGVMGVGQLGYACAGALAAVGFSVRGWARSKAVPGVRTFIGPDELPAFLAECEILVCLLPLTPQTEGILNRKLFAQLPRGAYLINVGRGGHLVEEDLIPALESRQLAGATLDVFREEPLPPNHPFWSHPRITVVPHISALTHPETAAAALVANLRRAIAGEPLTDVVDLEAGY